MHHGVSYSAVAISDLCRILPGLAEVRELHTANKVRLPEPNTSHIQIRTTYTAKSIAKITVSVQFAPGICHFFFSRGCNDAALLLTCAYGDAAPVLACAYGDTALVLAWRYVMQLHAKIRLCFFAYLPISFRINTSVHYDACCPSHSSTTDTTACVPSYALKYGHVDMILPGRGGAEEDRAYDRQGAQAQTSGTTLPLLQYYSTLCCSTTLPPAAVQLYPLLQYYSTPCCSSSIAPVLVPLYPLLQYNPTPVYQ
eukprot:243542-Rhodomonas_salina.1